ncbi:MAG: sigma-70 family RNA polymerase sigma factor [Flavobacteriales bacterium]|nr:sigma-70 family RNA polymerase sigma factor [Flavobacteriales bacterium]
MSNVAEWVKLYSDDLYHWAYYKTSKQEVAEDLIQETFFSALKSIDNFNEKSSAKTWLFSILNNKIIDYYRKNKKEIMITQSDLENEKVINCFFEVPGKWKDENNPLDWGELDTHLLDKEDFQKVLALCINNLPSIWKTTLQYKYLQNRKGTEICQELGISSTNYWQVLHRAKLKLRGCLETKWFNS